MKGSKKASPVGVSFFKLFYNIYKKIELKGQQYIIYYNQYKDKMERRINKKISEYVTEFKDDIKSKAIQLGLANDANMCHLVQYICDYERLTLTKDDFMKRKRVKNVVHLADRCCAKRANNEQCTRRRKDETSLYCGTHMKGTPHGVCDNDDDAKPLGQKVDVWAQDIQGIIYYIDKTGNVYQAEDIVVNKINPKIIAKYVKTGIDSYSIPEFGI